MPMRTRLLMGSAAALGFLAPGCGSSGASVASAPGVTSTSVTVGYIDSATGAASSTFVDANEGALARFALQNAEGGVDGRKIEMVSKDDQTSPTGFTTAAQDLVQNTGVFAILPISSLTFLGAAKLQKEGIPLIGSAFDGPEWGEQPYSNMFTFVPPFDSSLDGIYYNYNYYGTFLKDIGVTKYGVLAYGISPTSQEAAKAAVASANAVGVSTCYTNYSVPFGGADFTADVLQIKTAGCDGITAGFVDSSNVALAQNLREAGDQAKLWYLQGYDQSVLDSSSAAAELNGAYFGTSVVFDQQNPQVATMLNAMYKYGGLRPGQVPNFGQWTSYVAADMFIKGLEAAGRNPTRKSFITGLRGVTSYDAEGLLPTPVDFSAFGTPNEFPQTACSYFVQLVNDKFVRANVGDDGEICGQRITFKA